MLFIPAAYADAAPTSTGHGFDIMSFLPIVLIFGVFYFLILRPQQAKAKQHQKTLAALRRGDRVVTAGGLIGTISKIVSDHEVQLELADDVRVRLIRSMITEVLSKTDPISDEDEKPKPKAKKKTAKE